MSSFNLGKKLQPANKAWKSFTTTLQSKLQKLKLSKPIKKTKHHHYYHHHHHHHQLHNNFSAIYVDQLFEGPVWQHAKMNAKKQEEHVPELLRSKVLNEKELKRKSEKGVTNSFENLDDAWKATVASLPLVRGVDERAEEFISKFREDMKIQREQSILDFQEMLARSA